jgi:hypothetical protein
LGSCTSAMHGDGRGKGNRTCSPPDQLELGLRRD